MPVEVRTTRRAGSIFRGRFIRSALEVPLAGDGNNLATFKLVLTQTMTMNSDEEKLRVLTLAEEKLISGEKRCWPKRKCRWECAMRRLELRRVSGRVRIAMRFCGRWLRSSDTPEVF